MARFLAPPNPYDVFPIGCLKVYFPDNLFLYRALRAQLTELENRFVWDTGGDIEAAEKLEQDWLIAGQMTIEALDQGCGNGEDCQEIIIDLTLQIEQLQEQIQEYENMNITVNCNCNTTVNFPQPVTPTGEPINTVCLPVDPNNPTGEPAPITGDLPNEVPPDGWTDWQEFVDDRCLLANYAADTIIDSIAKLDDAENNLSVGGTILDAASIMLLLVPVSVGKLKGLVTIAKWVAALAGALGLASDFLEPFNDFLQTFEAEIRQRREQLACIIYKYYYSPLTMAQKLIDFMDDAVSHIDDLGLSQEIIDAAKALYAKIAQDVAPIVYQYAVKIYIPEDYQPSVDCDNCGPQLLNGGWMFVPVIFQNYVELDSANLFEKQVEAIGNEVQLYCFAAAGNLDLGPQWTFTIDAEPNSLTVHGFKIERTNLNGNANNFRWQTYEPAGTNKIWSGSVVTDTPSSANRVLINEGVTQYSDFVANNPGITVEPSTTVPDGLLYTGQTFAHRIVARSAAAGEMHQSQKLWLVCKAE